MKNSSIYTRDTFILVVGVVNADITHTRTGLRYTTQYKLVAERIHLLARQSGANSLLTVTDDGAYVVGIKGFQAPPPQPSPTGQEAMMESWDVEETEDGDTEDVETVVEPEAGRPQYKVARVRDITNGRYTRR